LALGGQSGNILYDWFIGRELNPRITLPIPFVSETARTIDIKIFIEMRPGMLGWTLVNSSSIAKQYATYGYITDSIIFITAFQLLYVLDALYMEPSILTTIDVTTDGFGFMLAFGNLVWLPLTYSIQTRYLAVDPVNLGIYGMIGVLAVQALGFYIFRSANNEKNRFRTNPADPRVSHLKFLSTRAGSRLLISGWWGRARHINYLGDWIMSWSYTLPTGFAGYQIVQSLRGKEVVPGEAKGWGTIFTYFYVLYFAVLLVHRERRDEEKCRLKYGADWEEYCKRVPSRIVPGIY
jgi:Delta14-sterol reductase